jgi:hypothetical protein
MSDNRYDVISTGSRPGAGSKGRTLQKTGKRTVVIERGDHLPRARENGDTNEMFRLGRYQAGETWASSRTR